MRPPFRKKGDDDSCSKNTDQLNHYYFPVQNGVFSMMLLSLPWGKSNSFNFHSNKVEKQVVVVVVVVVVFVVVLFIT